MSKKLSLLLIILILGLQVPPLAFSNGAKNTIYPNIKFIGQIGQGTIRFNAQITTDLVRFTGGYVRFNNIKYSGSSYTWPSLQIQTSSGSDMLITELGNPANGTIKYTVNHPAGASQQKIIFPVGTEAPVSVSGVSSWSYVGTTLTLNCVHSSAVQVTIRLVAGPTGGSVFGMPVWVEYNRTNYEPYNSTGTYDDGQLTIEDTMRLSYFVFPSDIGNDEINLTRLGWKYYKEFNYDQDHTLALYTAVDVDNAEILINYTAFNLDTTYNGWVYRDLTDEWDLNGDFTVYLGVWCEGKTGSYTIYFESVGQDYGSLEMAGAYIEPPPDPLVGETRNATIVYAFRVDYDHWGNTTTTYNQYWGTPTNYTARRDYNYTFPSGSDAREIRTLYPRSEEIINVTRQEIGVYNETLNEAEYTDELYNGSFNVITIPESTIALYGGGYRFFTKSLDYTYRLLGPYFENGTRAPALNATLHYPEASDEQVLNGTLIFGSDTQPIQITWMLENGEFRQIYLRTTSENITIFIPEDTYDLNEVYVRDYVGYVGIQDTYLEARRVVNGTTYLIERLRVQDMITGLPLFLTNYKVYSLRVVTASNWVYNFGFFVAGISDSIYVKIKNPPYTEQAQVSYKTISITAVREITNFTVSYSDSKLNTTLVELTIEYRNGSTAYFSNSTSDSVVFTWNNAINTTDYVVKVDVTHAFFLAGVHYSRYFDGITAFMPFPDLGIIGIAGNMLAVFIVFAVAFIITQFNSELGLFIGLIVAVALREFNALGASYDTLAILGGLIILYALGRRGER